MTKQEAQTIIDDIPSDTIIDHNWLGYLLEEEGLLKLQALKIVTEKNWKQLIEIYEGQEISVFQTEKPVLYIGKIVKVLAYQQLAYFMIISQDNNNCYYIDLDGELSFLNLKKINDYLI